MLQRLQTHRELGVAGLGSVTYSVYVYGHMEIEVIEERDKLEAVLALSYLIRTEQVCVEQNKHFFWGERLQTLQQL